MLPRGKRHRRRTPFTAAAATAAAAVLAASVATATADGLEPPAPVWSSAPVLLGDPDVDAHGTATYIAFQTGIDTREEDAVVQRYDADGGLVWSTPLARSQVQPQIDAGTWGVIVTDPSFSTVTRLGPDGDQRWVSTDPAQVRVTHHGLLRDAVVVGDHVVAVGVVHVDSVEKFQVVRLSLRTGEVTGVRIGSFGDGVSWYSVERIGRRVVMAGVAHEGASSTQFDTQVVVRVIDPRTLDPVWTRTLDTTERDQLGALSVLGRRIDVAGSTEGRLGGQRAYGGSDVFVASYTARGRRVLRHQTGGAGYDDARDVESTPEGPVVAWRRGSGTPEAAGVVTALSGSGAPRWEAADGHPVDALAWSHLGLRVVSGQRLTLLTGS